MNDEAAAAGAAGSHQEDLDLITRFLAGEVNAFERLFRKYQCPLFSVCRQFFGNIEDAEDVLQDAFLQIYKDLRRFKGRSTFFTWAYSVTVHACLTRARHRKSRDKTPAIEIRVTAPDPFRQQVRDAVLTLPDRFRMVIILQYYQELSQEEIARVLGWSVGQVKVNVHRARRLLREALGQEETIPAPLEASGRTHECGGEV